MQSACCSTFLFLHIKNVAFWPILTLFSQAVPSITKHHQAVEPEAISDQAIYCMWFVYASESQKSQTQGLAAEFRGSIWSMWQAWRQTINI